MTIVFISKARDAVGALGGGDAEINGEVVGDIDALASDGVAALGVLAEEGPVDALVRNLDRADIREKVERLAHRDVRGLDVRPRIAGARSGGRTLEDNVAALQLFHDVVRNSLHAGDTVLDRETVDDLELHLAGLHLIGEEVFEDVLRRLGDDRSDAVAAADADRDDRELIVVDDVL